MKQAIIGSISFAIAAAIVGLLGYSTESADVRWAILAVALGLLGTGLAFIVLMLNSRIEITMNELNEKLSRIEELQKELQNEQREQSKDHSPFVMPIQALSEYYLDYLAKQADKKSEED